MTRHFAVIESKGRGNWTSGFGGPPRFAAGKVALPDVRYWVNSGRHMLAASSSQFDPTLTSADSHRTPYGIGSAALN